MLILASLSHCDLGAEMMVFGAVIVYVLEVREKKAREKMKQKFSMFVIVYGC